MDRTARFLITSAVSIVCGVGFVGCGQEAAQEPAAPAAKAPAPAKSVQEISAEAQRCLDLVKAKQYAEALQPCERAVKDTANADVERAYAEAKAEAQKVAEAAAAQAATDALSGKPADEAAKDAAADAMKKYGQ